MNAFSSFGIKPELKSFTGDKIKISRIMNRQVSVLDFKIEASKFAEKGNGKCLYLQIELEQKKYVVFTGSVVLMDMIQKVAKDKFPFTTTIIEENEIYQFT